MLLRDSMTDWLARDSIFGTEEVQYLASETNPLNPWNQSLKPQIPWFKSIKFLPKALASQYFTGHINTKNYHPQP